MSFDRREYVGGAPSTTLNGNITQSTTTITLLSGTGYPGGGVGNFVIVIDPGLVGEEKILCSNLTGETITVVPTVGRGHDDTSASAHTSGAEIHHVAAAIDLAEANQHYADATLDHHTNYLTEGRHDIESRHTYGAAYGTPVTATAVTTSAAGPATGTGNNPAREDHVHDLATGSIDNANLFAAGVVDLAALDTDSVDSGQYVDGSIDAEHYADDSIAVAKLKANSIDSDQYVDASIDPEHFAADAVGFPVLADTMVPHSSLDVVQPTSGANVTGNVFLDWPPSGAQGPLKITGFVKRRDDTHIIVEITGPGYPVNTTSHRYTLAVHDGTDTVTVSRWYSNEQAVSAQEHAQHGGMVDLGALSAATYTFTAKLKTSEVASVTGWHTDAEDTWSMKITETH